MSIIPNPEANFTPPLKGYSGQGAFRFWCQTVLPLVYDDSLSYYELLNKVVTYLNNTISDVANMEDNVQGLHDAYVSLQNYVNEYFSTLNVQEEIDAKLDEMASDGTLSALVSPLLPDMIADWLSEHITPTTPVVDNTLTIEGAAADAKTVGVNMMYPKSIAPYISGDDVIDLNNVLEQGHYVIDASHTITNAPDNFVPTGFIVERFRIGTTAIFVRQVAFKFGFADGEKYYIRHCNVNGSWSEWKPFDTIDALTVIVPYNYNLADISHYGLGDNGAWNMSTAQNTCIFPIPKGVKKIRVTAGTNGAIIAFLKTFEPVVGETGDYSTNHPARITLNAGTTDVYTIGSDDIYMYTMLITADSANRYRTPVTKLICPELVTDDKLYIPGLPADAAACGAVATTANYNKQDLKHLNIHNYLAMKDNETTSNGVTFTPNGDGSYTIKRITQSSTFSIYNLTNSTDPLSTYDLQAGDTCYIGLQDAENCRLQIFSYDSESTSTYLGTAYKDYPEIMITIPDTSVGLLVRLRINAGDDANETVYPYFTHRATTDPANSIIPRVTYGRAITDNAGAITTETITVDGVVTEVSTVHLDAVKLPGYYIIDSNMTVDGAPEGFRPQFIAVDNMRTYVSNGFIRQTIGRMTTNIDTVYYRFTNSLGTAFNNWAQIAGGSGGVINNYTYNNTNTFENTISQNTYNVTATPTISAENLYYLAPSGDTSDRTNDIATMLQTNGVCRLGAGTYYVGNLQMPNNSAIIGVGAHTVIRLLDSVTDGYAVRMSEACSIENCVIRGAESYSARRLEAATPGTRVGILWSGADSVLPTRGLLSNLRIENFNGSGVLCRESTMQTIRNMLISNCFFSACDAGLNIAYLSEFHQVVNCHFYGCYYGVINNGGNNNFSNCDFVSNATHFQINNTSGTLQNPAHSVMSNCEMAHAYGLSESGEFISNSGKAIEIIGIPGGYHFTGCAFGYGKIVLTNSGGITFTGCMWSGGRDYNVIEITAGTGILFNGCIFASNPDVRITDNDVTRFVNCYTKDGLTNVNP